ncbi:DUF1990 family protein [Tersicoccus phoenicis]|uniref:DUF1990 family protein n=1 Tax=Tersicoccus phoenicis TaxID=554083 RepID=UPI0013566758|nr:DUF1990 domain-containing protein [Tersicoccus phoenicis]
MPPAAVARGLTYHQVGWTAAGWWPPGYRWTNRRGVVGHGEHAFERLGTAIAHWEILSGAGLSVDADDDVARPGAQVRSTVSAATLLGADAVARVPVFLRGLLCAGLTAPCRVVWVAPATVVSPLAGRTPVATSGFGYGTLPGHPERGEEAFLAHLYDDGDVEFEVRAFSRPATAVFTLGAPIGRRLQRFITDRYVDAARAVVTAERDQTVAGRSRR